MNWKKEKRNCTECLRCRYHHQRSDSLANLSKEALAFACLETQRSCEYQNSKAKRMHENVDTTKGKENNVCYVFHKFISMKMKM